MLVRQVASRSRRLRVPAIGRPPDPLPLLAENFGLREAAGQTELDRPGGDVARVPYKPSPPIESKTFTVPEIDAGIRKLRRRIEDLQKLQADQVAYDDARVDVVESDI